MDEEAGFGLGDQASAAWWRPALNEVTAAMPVLLSTARTCACQIRVSNIFETIAQIVGRVEKSQKLSKIRSNNLDVVTLKMECMGRGQDMQMRRCAARERGDDKQVLGNGQKARQRSQAGVWHGDREAVTAMTGTNSGSRIRRGCGRTRRGAQRQVHVASRRYTT